MNQHIDFFKAIFSAIFWLSIFLAYSYFRRRDAAGAKYLAITMLLNSLWAGGVLMGIQSNLIITKELSLSVSFAASVFVPSMVLAFVLHFIGKKELLSVRNLVFINLIPFFLAIISFIPSLKHLLWEITDADFKNYYFVRNYGIFFWIFVFYGYSIIAAIIALFFISIKVFTNHNPFNWLYYSVAIVLGVGTNLVQFFGVGYFGSLDITPAGLAMGFGLIFFTVFNFKVFELIPAAEELIVKNSNSAILVVNNSNRVVLNNSSFEKNLYVGNIHIEGRSLISINTKLHAEVMKKISENSFVATDFENENMHFLLTVCPVYRRNNVKAGHIIMLDDISERKLLEQNLYISNIHLLEQLTANESCVEDEKVIYQSITNDLKPTISSITNISEIVKGSIDNEVLRTNMGKTLNYLGLKASSCADDIVKYVGLGTKELVMEKVSLLKVFEDAIESNRAVIEKNQAKIVMPQNLPEVNGNEKMLIEAITIIVKNILLSSDVPVQITLKVDKILNQWTSLSLKFNLKSEDVRKFEAMITSNGDLSLIDYKAAGIEMFIAKRMLRLMNAEVNLETISGATIFIRFPF